MKYCIGQNELSQKQSSEEAEAPPNLDPGAELGFSCFSETIYFLFHNPIQTEDSQRCESSRERLNWQSGGQHPKYCGINQRFLGLEQAHFENSDYF